MYPSFSLSLSLPLHLTFPISDASEFSSQTTNSVQVIPIENSYCGVFLCSPPMELSALGRFLLSRL